MSAPQKNEGGYQQAIRSCVENGSALLEDADLMHTWERYGTAYALTVLAEEEFSKAFLLYLVQDDAVPWTSEVRRAIHDHQSKHLLAVLMEHLADRGEDWIEGVISGQQTAQEDMRLPAEEAAAINLFRHEKIGKWQDPFSWDVLEAEDYDPETKRVADGSLDRAKQNAIYVNVGRDGRAFSTPASVSGDQSGQEMKRCKRLQELATGMAHGEKGYIMASREYEQLKDVLRAMFRPPVIHEQQTQATRDAQQDCSTVSSEGAPSEEP